MMEMSMIGYMNISEKVEKSKRCWDVQMIDEFGANRGCTGFKTKKEAKDWYEENKKDMRKYFNIESENIVYIK